LTFGDNKRRFSFDFFSGSPGLMRVKIHRFVETKGKILIDKKEIKETVRELIFNQLKVFNRQN
jgi:1-acyl-sn-glycerol-3-phosphate acyltransferase